jgi:hypothetical protein
MFVLAILVLRRRHRVESDPGVGGVGWWGTKWGTKPHLVQPISAKLDFVKTA